MSVWLTVGVVESVWLVPQYEDVLGHAIGPEMMKTGVNTAPRPSPDSVGRGYKLSYLCSPASTGANGNQLKVRIRRLLVRPPHI
jgi:hypothetical protein